LKYFIILLKEYRFYFGHAKILSYTATVALFSLLGGLFTFMLTTPQMIVKFLPSNLVASDVSPASW